MSAEQLAYGITEDEYSAFVKAVITQGQYV